MTKSCADFAVSAAGFGSVLVGCGVAGSAFATVVGCGFGASAFGDSVFGGAEALTVGAGFAGSAVGLEAASAGLATSVLGCTGFALASTASELPRSFTISLLPPGCSS